MTGAATPECDCGACECSNDADLIEHGHTVCACCLADCPDVHGPEGLTWYRRLTEQGEGGWRR